MAIIYLFLNHDHGSSNPTTAASKLSVFEFYDHVIRNTDNFED